MSSQNSNRRAGAQYDEMARRWHGVITRLGYCDAYRTLFDTPLDFAPRRVLDIGCGSGAMTDALLHRHGPAKQVDLLDSSGEMLRVAAKNIARRAERVSTVKAKLEAAHLPDRYDAVLCGHVIEHLDAPEVALKQMRRLLNPTGTLFLSVSKPHWCTTLLRWKWRHRAFRPQSVRAILRAAGFCQIQTVAFRRGPPSRTSCGYRARPEPDQAVNSTQTPSHLMKAGRPTLMIV